MSTEVSNTAYRYALVFYLLFAAFFWYLFHSAGLFIGQHFVRQSASGFSVVNPNFNLINNSIATVLAIVCAIILFANERLKEYTVDVGDELTRVSWPELKETQRATLVVIALVIVSSIFLFLADLVFLRFINFIIGTAA